MIMFKHTISRILEVKSQNAVSLTSTFFSNHCTSLRLGLYSDSGNCLGLQRDIEMS